MAYRTKIYNRIWSNYLDKVFEFIGLTIDGSSGCSRIKWVGCDFTKNNKPVPSYFTTTKYDRVNKKDLCKINVVIRSQDEFINYKTNKEHYEYFNPIIKPKQMLKLLMMMTPIIYERYCITDTDDFIKELVDMIVSDEKQVTQEEILKYVNIKQYPSVSGIDGELIYKFGIELNRDNGESYLIVSESKNKSVAILLLMIKIIELIDGNGIEMDERYFEDIRLQVEELFEDYTRERELNYKDSKNIVIEKEITDFSQEDICEENMYDNILLTDMSSSEEEKLIEENTDKQGTINISNIYQNCIPIMPKETDDDLFEGLTFL